jgi:hypothetical protein
MSTLKYVERAKAIVNSCTVNDIHASNPFITKLRAEIDVLTQRLTDEARGREKKEKEAEAMGKAMRLVEREKARAKQEAEAEVARVKEEAEEARRAKEEEVEVARRAKEEEVEVARRAKEEEVEVARVEAEAREAALKEEREDLEGERTDLHTVVESLQEVRIIWIIFHSYYYPCAH